MITLYMQTEKTINELTKTELDSIHWGSFEQYYEITAATYKKLDKNGRAHVCSAVYCYDEKDVEYWNQVFTRKPSDNGFIRRLLNNAENPRAMINAHIEYFSKHLRIEDKLYYGISPFSEYLTKHGYTLDNIDSYRCFASPYLSESFFTEEVPDEHGNAATALAVIRELAVDDYAIDDYTILATNESLVKSGYISIPDITEASLKEAGACGEGTRFAKKMFKLHKTESLSWDFIIEFIRENPPEYVDNIQSYLSWWWTEANSYS